jgi:hypothetical protein
MSIAPPPIPCSTIDNDDGSSYFTAHNNFMVYGGEPERRDTVWSRACAAWGIGLLLLALLTPPHDSTLQAAPQRTTSRATTGTTTATSTLTWAWASTTGPFHADAVTRWWLQCIHPRSPCQRRYGGQVGTPGQGQLDGHEDSFTSNTLVLNQASVWGRGGERTPTGHGEAGVSGDETAGTCQCTPPLACLALLPAQTRCPCPLPSPAPHPIPGWRLCKAHLLRPRQERPR